MNKAVYNTIGKIYDATRQADPLLAKKIIELLQPKHDKRYLDIGCGSGNYTHVLTGINISGVDISTKMMMVKRSF